MAAPRPPLHTLLVPGAILTAFGLGWLCLLVSARTESATRRRTTASPVPAPAVPSRLLLDPVRADDPSVDGWDSEVFAAAAARRLRLLGPELLGESVKSEARSEPWAWVAGDFRCDPLRPSDLAEAHRDRAYRVRRPSRGSPADSNTEHVGSDGLLAAARAHAARFDGTRDRRIAFKIHHIEPAAGALLTRVHVEASGRTDSAAVQTTATWVCRWTTGSANVDPRLHRIQVEEYEEVEARATGGAAFRDQTGTVLGSNPSVHEQLAFGLNHWLERIDFAAGMRFFGRYGLAVGDLDGDGWDDLYVPQPGGLPNRLYLRRPDGTAADASADSGADLLDQSISALIVDWDGDGDQDLAVATTSAGVVLLENDGAGRFRVRGSLPCSADVQSMCAADYDLDGDLDLYVCVDFADAPNLPWEPRVPFVYHDANDGGPNVLFRNDGEWRFRDVTRETGMDADNRRRSLGAAWEDFDADGDPDLYVANDYGRNCLYRNDGGRFVNVAEAAGVEDFGSGMSVAWGDYDGDQRPDLYVGNMFSSAGGRITAQDRFKPEADAELRARYQRFAKGNTLFRNRGDGVFQDVSHEAGVAMGRWARSSSFVDLNQDGALDLVVANGYLTGPDPGDLESFFWRRVVSQGRAVPIERRDPLDGPGAGRVLFQLMQQGRSFSGGERNCAFLNIGDGRFADVSAVTGIDFPDDGRAVGVVDWDLDGDLDLWFANRTGPQLRYLRNDAPAGGAFAAIRLVGKTRNRDAIGARVTVFIRDRERQELRPLVRTLRAGEGYLAQSSKWMHFGLGPAGRVERLVVRWPEGPEEEFVGVEANAFQELRQGEGRARPVRRPSAPPAPAAGPLATPAPPAAVRVRLLVPLPFPTIYYNDLDGRLPQLRWPRSRPLLVNLWSATCRPCVEELREWTRHADDLQAAGLDVLALGVDGVTGNTRQAIEGARAFLGRLGFPFEGGRATQETIDRLEFLLGQAFDFHRPLPIPTGFLVEPNGRLAVVYKGRIPLARLLEDVRTLGEPAARRRERALPFPGRWVREPVAAEWATLAGNAVGAGFFEDARLWYDAALAQNPDDVSVHLGIAQMWEKAGDFAAVERAYREVTRLAPEWAMGYNNLGVTLDRLERWPEAEQAFRNALRLDPKLELAQVNLGRQLYRERRLEDARDLWQSAVRAAPESANAHNNLGFVHFSLKDLKSALPCYREAIRLDPNHVHARRNLGLALAMEGFLEEAIREFEAAVRIDPTATDAASHLARARSLMRPGPADPDGGR